ncbi:unnamed protein product [Cylicocyclus nassatus]|uniref:G-protein coupled receptors family 1 profile domain-containing protein n=1 Tax=Cylicocyclus nassatus TaxID=53992 RepID=A0AA36MCG7_CYLNA|nr:unnamed protein product [Cylicocyclus nassatus]
MISFATLQFAMVAERYVALWKRSSYETFGKKLGISFAFFSVTAGFAIVSWTTRIEEFSALPYCTPSSPRAVERITLLCYLLCSINVITLVGVAVLFTGNHIAVKSKRFDLSSSYQLKENYSVIKLLLPLSVFQKCNSCGKMSGGSGVPLSDRLNVEKKQAGREHQRLPFPINK